MAIARDNAIRRIAAVFGQGRSAGFYDSPAAMRDLDLLIRNRLAADLSRAATRFREAYAAGHRDLARPSRESPLGDPVRLRELASVKAAGERLQDLAALVHAQPAPAGDRVWRKIHREGPLLDQLIAWDYAMAEVGEQLAAIAAEPESLPVDQVDHLVEKIRGLLRDRQALITGLP